MTNLKWKPGTVVALTQAKVWVGDNPSEPSILSGLFVIEEHIPYEPAAYHWEDGWMIYPEGKEDEGLFMFISTDELQPQIDPKGYGEMLFYEREDADSFEFAMDRGELID